MTTWVNDGFVGEMFKLTGAFLPPPPPGVSRRRCGASRRTRARCSLPRACRREISRELVVFEFASVDAAVSEYTDAFGPFVMARKALEPQGRWDEFVTAFRDLVTRFNPAQDGGAEIESEYYLITADR